MFRFALRRLLLALPVLFIAVTFAFFVLRLAPGGPFDGERPMHPEIKANLEAYYHLDKPLFTQYRIYMTNVLHGELGPSFTDRTYSVNEKIAQGLPYTLRLGGLALLLAVVVGTFAGVIGALRQNTSLDYFIAFIVLIGIVIPNFVMAPVMQEYLIKPVNAFATYLNGGQRTQIFAMSGWGSGGFKNIAIPVLILSLTHIGRISRLMRASMIEVLGTNYIRTAKAKGIGERLTITRHALRPAFVPVLSYLGPAAGYLLTGSLVVEMIFGLPGIGKFFIDSALSRDYGMVLGTVIFYMLLITLLNLIVDILYAYLDPKVRLS
ncbi:MAG: ABC transporter permease subunit [Alphaproteobacteria bacterium]